MEIADVKRRVVETIERAKQGAAGRRARMDDAAKAYEGFLERTAVPVFRQVANVLRSEGYPFSVFTPSGSVRLMSDRTAEDYVELTLDTTGGSPSVTGHSKRTRGRRLVESERALGAPDAIGEEDVLTFVLEELEPMVDR